MGSDEQFPKNRKGFFSRFASCYYSYHSLGYFIRFNHFKEAIRDLRFNSVLDAGCCIGKFGFFIADDRLLQKKGLRYLRALLLSFFKAISYLDTIAPDRGRNAFFVLAQKVE